MNWVGHIPFAFWLVDMLCPKLVVELGTHSGNSYFAFCQGVRRNQLPARCFAVDTWKGEEHAGYYGEEIFADVCAWNERYYGDFSTLLRMTFDEAQMRFADRSIDLLHIDGRHTYEAVRHDFELWFPKLSSASVVLFHDIAVRERGFGVWRLWNELSERYPSVAFEHSNGLGVLFTGSDQSLRMKEFLQFWQFPEERQMFIMAAEKLGRAIGVAWALDAKSAAFDNLSVSFRKLEKNYERVIHSSSWRITNPYRRLLKSIRRQGRSLRQILPSRAVTEQRLYLKWIEQYDIVGKQLRSSVVDCIAMMQRHPVLSVVMTTYNTPAGFLEAAIRSVQGQLYPYWELCIADDYSSDASVRAVIEKFAGKDDRISYVFRQERGHISEAGNSALELVSGDYVALLDHDDILHPLALFLVAEEILRFPDAGVMYTDEDKIDRRGMRVQPYCKCDYNYDLFLSQNMISHFGVYKAGLVRAVGGFRQGLEGAQDYDLALRIVETIPAEQVRHIPRVLYHWRMHKASTSVDSKVKPYAHRAALRAVQEHLERTGVRADVEHAPEAEGMIRVRYRVGTDEPSVEIVVLTRDKAELLQQCMMSVLQRTTYRNYSVVIVDNGSCEPETMRLFAELECDRRVRIYRDDSPFNFSRLNNRAVAGSNADYICLMNNDIEVLSPGWLDEMMGHAIQPGVGAVGARLWYPDMILQHAGVIMGLGGVAGHAHKHLAERKAGYFGRACVQQSFSAVTAACMLVERLKYDLVGGLNEERLAIAFNDVDFCLKLIEAGLRNVWTPYAELLHHESATRGLEDSPEKQERFRHEVLYMQERWAEMIAADPAYNPNLRLDYPDRQFSLAFPPRRRSCESLW